MSASFMKVGRGITLQPLSSAPTSPINGDLYYNSALNKFQLYQNGGWIEPGGTSFDPSSVTTNILPDLTITRNLGSTTKAWSNIYGVTDNAVVSYWYSNSTFTTAKGSLVGNNTGFFVQSETGAPLAVQSSQGLMIYSGLNDTANARNITLQSNINGNLGASNSGDINLITTIPSGSGTRGKVSLDANYLDMNSHKIQNLATPTLNSDATTKAYVDGKFVTPTVQRFLSGSGTYTTPVGVRYLIVTVIGPGGGGGGSGVTGGGNGFNAASPTTFGSSLLTANGGNGGNWAGPGGSGGSPTVNAPAITIYSVEGGGGGASSGALQNFPWGGTGGNTMLGGGGRAGSGSAPPVAGAINSGAGGGGAGADNASSAGGGGGGAGASIKVIIPSPAASYPYSVGVGGAGGTAGTGTGAAAGKEGSDGLIVVEEIY